MSNVISIGAPRRPNLAQRQSLLLESFARHRRRADDVYWLKENAEILNVLATGGATLGPQALTIYEAFYRSIEERLRFFPQYYRFLLSICLDLEDLGLPGGKGEALCHWAQRSKLSASELSDLQRAEAERLFARRGAVVRDRALEDRLRAFICHSETFALPNKKAAYELTHIVFYLSNYGSQCPGLSRSAVTSLEFAALMAFLDQDIDLLSEVCVALRFAGVVPSEVWEDWLTQALGEFVLSAAPDGAVNDCYHHYLVTSWWAGISGGAGYPGTPLRGCVEIQRYAARKGPLRTISELLYVLGPARSGNWSQMRVLLEDKLEEDQHLILRGAARSSAQFDAFFEGFSRAQII